MKIETKVEHTEKVEAVIEHEALDQLLIEAVAKKARLSLRRRNVTATVVIDQLKDVGSSTARHRARVVITIDHAAVAEAAEGQPHG